MVGIKLEDNIVVFVAISSVDCFNMEQKVSVLKVSGEGNAIIGKSYLLVIEIGQISFLATGAFWPVLAVVLLNAKAARNAHSVLDTPGLHFRCRTFISNPNIILALIVLIKHAFESVDKQIMRLRRRLRHNHGDAEIRRLHRDRHPRHSREDPLGPKMKNLVAYEENSQESEEQVHIRLASSDSIEKVDPEVEICKSQQQQSEA
jgi:hypothetical protein